MEKTDQLRELWRMQRALNERIGVRIAQLERRGTNEMDFTNHICFKMALERKVR